MDNSSIARAGEYFAASVFEARGIRAAHVDLNGADLWVRTPSGRMLAVQVKTTNGMPRHTSRKGGLPRFRFHHCVGDADLFCFVALSMRCLLVDEPSESVNRILALSRFTPEAMEESIVRYLY